ncbi:hypothetical protein [Tumebacillus permanentifrigoris]|uniref:Uncharacterized protein n=1 Tax=Tumebacillus permanentifrigoris TaxID=378543 RepID=A0A316D7W3_9BACL|nr:hypothetical protein [Tumebacillus permanentifrigoris]PWK12829.1 hypothetical protein C7459_109191 [Tumebacillus permanentifrigoris]
MKKNMLLTTAFVVLVGVGVFSYNYNPLGTSNSPQTDLSVSSTTQEIPYSQETSLPTTESSASIGKLYHNDKEMFKEADIVALVKVNEQEVVSHSDSLVTTKSQVSIEQAFKGKGPSGLLISELGGPVDFSKIPDIGKSSDGKPKQTGVMETTIEGSTVMKKGHSYFVFLKQNPDAQWGYNILGSVQGKFRYDDEKNMAVTTVAESHFKEELFFLQKEHAGKGKKELVQYFNSLS